MYNVAIVGGGPAGIFSALEITKLHPDWKIVLIDKGDRIEKRHCLLRDGLKNVRAAKPALFCVVGAAQVHFPTAN